MQEQYWSNTSNLQIYSAHWTCANPRAVIALIHGQGEHINRYQHLARFFNDAQIAVWGHDQQGFGKSEGKRGHAPDFQAYLDDVQLLLDHITAFYPGTPVILYGHSMGGNVALNYALRTRDPRIHQLVATGPWIRLAFEPPQIKVLAGKLLKSLFPALSLPSGLDTALISRDPQVVDLYNNDPLVHDKVSAAAGIGLMEGAAWLDQFSGEVPCPTLLMHGGADGITAAAATKAFASRLTGDVTYREWPGLFHEIHNEPEQLDVFQVILDFIKQH